MINGELQPEWFAPEVPGRRKCFRSDLSLHRLDTDARTACRLIAVELGIVDNRFNLRLRELLNQPFLSTHVLNCPSATCPQSFVGRCLWGSAS